MPAAVTQPQAHPPRFHWLKRITISVLLLLATLVLLRLIWGWRVQREFDALIASYRAKGEPTTAADFDLKPIPDEENAAPLLWQAAAIVRTPIAVWEAEYRNAFAGPSIAAADFQLLRQHVAANAAALPLARSARQRPRVHWAIPVASPFKPGMNAPSEVGHLLRFAASVAHEAGDDHAAIEYLHDAFFVARALDHHPHSQFQTGSIIMSDRGCRAILQIVPNLQISTTPPTNPSLRPALRRRIDDLIADLLDDTERNAAAVRVLKAHRLQFTQFLEEGMRIDLLQPVRRLVGSADAATIANVIGPVVRPVLYRGAIDSLHHIDATIGVIDTADWRVARTYVHPDYRHAAPMAPFPRPVPITRVLTADFLHGVSGFTNGGLIVDRHVRTVRRVAALRLAIRAYEIDHAGARPPSLEALVPDYIPHVPLDPFGDGIATIGYFPAAPLPYLSSVGPDGNDDIARGAASVDGILAANETWISADLVFPLNAPAMPTSAPTTLPVENQK